MGRDLGTPGDTGEVTAFSYRDSKEGTAPLDLGGWGGGAALPTAGPPGPPLPGVSRSRGLRSGGQRFQVALFRRRCPRGALPHGHRFVLLQGAWLAGCARPSSPAGRGRPLAPTRSACTAGVLYLRESDTGQLRAFQKAARWDTRELPRLVGTFGGGTQMTTLDVSFVEALAPAVWDISALWSCPFSVATSLPSPQGFLSLPRI